MKKKRPAKRHGKRGKRPRCTGIVIPDNVDALIVEMKLAADPDDLSTPVVEPPLEPVGEKNK